MPRQAFIFTSGHTHHLQQPPLFNIDFKKQLLRPALGVASTFETRQTEFITKDEKRRCVSRCQSLSAGVSHRATAALICCLSLPRTGECGAITRACLISRALILSPRKKRCSISPTPLSGQLASFRKPTRRTTQSVDGFPRHRVLSAQSDDQRGMRAVQQQCDLRCNRHPVPPPSPCGASCLQRRHSSVSKSGAERLERRLPLCIKQTT